MTDEVKNEPLIDIEHFAKVKMAIGRIASVAPHPNADRLLVIQVAIGDQTRQLVAGMRKWYSPEEMVGKKVVVVTNLKPVKLRGVESRGMLLAAEAGDDVVLLGIDRDISDGAKVR